MHPMIARIDLAPRRRRATSNDTIDARAAAPADRKSNESAHRDG